MTTLHMETEQVRELARKLDELALEISSKGSILKSSSSALKRAWQGGDSHTYQNDFQALTKGLDNSAEDLQNLSLRVTHEVDEWESVDKNGDFAGVCSDIPKFAPYVPVIVEPGSGHPRQIIGLDLDELYDETIKSGASVFIDLIDKVEKFPLLPKRIIDFIKDLLEGLILDDEDIIHAATSALLNAGITTGIETLINLLFKGLFGQLILYSAGIQLVGNIIIALLNMTGQSRLGGIIQNSLDVIDLGGYIDDIADGITDWLLNPVQPNPFGKVIERISKIGKIADDLISS